MRKTIIALIICGGVLAAPAARSAVTTEDLVADAPARYVVVPGDTLWSISQRYLKSPWRWPELWQYNREHVRNPHRIYPGDVLVLDQARAGYELQVQSSEPEVVKLVPSVSTEAIAPEPIPTIPATSIAPFLSQPLVINPGELDTAARIVATQEDRVVLGINDTAFAEGVTEGQGDYWQVFRQGNALVDPDTKKTIGYQAIYLGDVRVTRFGEVSNIVIVKSPQEIVAGDRLLPGSRNTTLDDFQPHAPAAPVKARIIDIYNDLFETGPAQIVVLNRGSQDGLEPGNVLALYRDLNSPTYRLREKDMKYRNEPMGDRNSPLYGRVGPTGSDGKDAQAKVVPNAKLPDARYGLIMVFRTFDHASFALVMNADRPVALFDNVLNP